MAGSYGECVFIRNWQIGFQSDSAIFHPCQQNAMQLLCICTTPDAISVCYLNNSNRCIVVIVIT